MSKLIYVCTTLLGVSLLQSATAEESRAWQITPYVGYATQSSYQTEDRGSLIGEDSAVWGLMAGQETEDPGMVEFIYSHQNSDVKLTDGTTTGLQLDYLHFAGVLFFQDGATRPYIGAGIGGTLLSGYSSEIRPSMSLAFGIQQDWGKHLALRAEVRGYGTLIEDDSTFICNPDICTVKVKGDTMYQGQANIGLTFRF